MQTNINEEVFSEFQDLVHDGIHAQDASSEYDDKYH